MNTNKDILEAINNVKAELEFLRSSKAPRAQQVDCFNRLITLYGALNIEHAMQLELKTLEGKQVS